MLFWKHLSITRCNKFACLVCVSWSQSREILKWNNANDIKIRQVSPTESHHVFFPLFPSYPKDNNNNNFICTPKIYCGHISFFPSRCCCVCLLLRGYSCLKVLTAQVRLKWNEWTLLNNLGKWLAAGLGLMRPLAKAQSTRFCFKRNIFSSDWRFDHTYLLKTVTKTVSFQKRFPEWRFLKTGRFALLVWKDENRGFRWRRIVGPETKSTWRTDPLPLARRRRNKYKASNF